MNQYHEIQFPQSHGKELSIFEGHLYQKHYNLMSITFNLRNFVLI